MITNLTTSQEDHMDPIEGLGLAASETVGSHSLPEAQPQLSTRCRRTPGHMEDTLSFDSSLPLPQTPSL